MLKSFSFGFLVNQPIIIYIPCLRKCSEPVSLWSRFGIIFVCVNPCLSIKKFIIYSDLLFFIAKGLHSVYM